MSAPTTTRSAYPPPVDDLMPKARDLATDLGTIPSRNSLIKALRVGGPKARAVRDRLVEELSDTGQTEEPDPDPIEHDDQETAPNLGEVEQSEPETTAEVSAPVDPGATTPPIPARTLKPWPVLLLALPAFIAIWSGWVGLGTLSGFGIVHPLPGILDEVSLNTAITLPVGMETYAAYALRVWLTPGLPTRARRFARWSAIGSLVLGAAGQVAYHLMTAAGMHSAPWQITTLVSCLPVAVLGMGAALAHLLRNPDA
jgi:hypothetical protein